MTDNGAGGLPLQIPARFTPQTCPTPTPVQALSLARFVRARLRSCDSRGDCRDVAEVLVRPGGVLDRYLVAVRYAAVPPRGLEEAWSLVAATLSVIVSAVADRWADHPDHPRHHTP